MSKTKICSRCKRPKSTEEFTKRTASVDGLFYMCRLCSRAQGNIYNARDRKKDPSRYRARGQRYRKKYEESTTYCVRQMLYRAKTRANKAGIPFSLKISDVKIPEVCPILGIPLRQHKAVGKREDNSPSLDKVIPSLGYIPSNIIVMSDRANRIKNEGTAREHELVAKFLRRREQ